MQSRRDFLRFATMMTGVAGLSELIPESIRRAYAIEPAPGSTFLDAEHIVILMQENRSFDHTFGTLRGVRGFNDPRAMRLANGNSVFVQTDAEGNSYAPWRLDIHDTRITWMGSLPHSRHSQVDAWNQGFHDGWLEAKRSGDEQYAHLPLTMGYYTREDLPFYYALADAFTTCDQNYCSVMSSTSPNRSYFWSGTIRDQQQADSRVHIRNEQIDYGGLTWKTYPERLEDDGISWKHYQNELSRSALIDEKRSWLSNFTDNPLECFSAYHVEAYPGFSIAAERWIAELSDEAAKLEGQLANEKDVVAASSIRRRIDGVQGLIGMLRSLIAHRGDALSDRDRSLHDKAFVTNAGDPHYHALDLLEFECDGKVQSMNIPKGDILYQFRKDVNEGKLPMVSWLTAPENFSDHPSAPWYGAWYISEILNILTSNPEVWKKTIFILTYDENDGYFDHAPSFVAADPKQPESGGASAGIDCGLEYASIDDELRMGVDMDEARSGPIGMGFRVPMIVASPWSRGGWVNSQVFDHTSTLMFLEQFLLQKYGKHVREENISAWRRAVAGDLTSVFRPYDPNDLQLDYLKRDPFVVSIEKARYKQIPSNFKELTSAQIELINRSPRSSGLLPHQEKGTRPSCALPYELYADGSLSEDGGYFEIRLNAANSTHGAASAGAPFNVCVRNLNPKSAAKGTSVATYAVKAGDTLLQRCPLVQFTNLRYVVEINGPNGFYRSFSGDRDSSAVSVRTFYERGVAGLTGNIELELRNPANARVNVEIIDNAYKSATINRGIGPREAVKVVMALEQSHGWYDVAIKTSGTNALIQLAGRVETGRAASTDPQMAEVV